MIRRTLLLAGLLLVALAAPAHAQYAPGVTTDRAAVVPGGEVGVSACCFPPGSSVVFSIGGVVLGQSIADGNGVASGTFTVPGNVAAGAATVSASATTPQGQVITQTGALQVSGTSATTAAVGGLPVTGAGTTVPISAIAVVLVALGGLATLAGRRRQGRVSSDL